MALYTAIISGDDSNRYELRVDFTVTSQSAANNTSTVSYDVYAYYTGSMTYGRYWQGGSSGYIEGTGFTRHSASGLSYDFRNNRRMSIVSGTKTIAHNSNGTLTFALKAYVHLYNESYNMKGTLTKSITFPAHTFTVAFNNYDGTRLKTETVARTGNATPPSAPARTGYTFSGWSGTYTNVTSNKTITATFSINQYKVTFKNWDGTTLKTQTVDYGSNASAPTAPSRTGYTFSSWSGTYTNVTSNRTITAVFKINSYTVRFENWNGTLLKSQTVNYGSNASPPASPTRTGYTFSGWSGTYTSITSNRTITATFTINSYSVVFKDWDGTTLKNQKVNYGSNASPPASPTRVGYNFIGWSGTYTNITSARTITATYERAVPNFVMKVNGSNRNAAQMWVKVNGQLRIAEQAKVLVSGILRDI